MFKFLNPFSTFNSPLSTFSPQVWQDLARWLHGKQEYSPALLAEPEPQAAITETSRILSQELKKLNIEQKIPAELTARLEDNIFFFSGFKHHHQLVEASRMLRDGDGNIKPFQRFLNDIETLDKTYNRSYLSAEYNFAEASTQMAIRWQDWQADGDTYNLQYRTANDGHVREEHAALEGTTLPPSDPFWQRYLPPNGWNCRCNAVQVRADKYPQSNSQHAVAIGDEMTKGAKNQIFRFNPGAQQTIFPPKHPYYKAPKEVREVLGEIGNTALKTMPRKEANTLIKNELISKQIPVHVSEHNKTGLIKLNAYGLKNFLYNGHSLTSESKWVLHEIYRGNALLSKPAFETLNEERPNIDKKKAQGWTGVHIYTINAFGKRWELKTAIIRDYHEVPYSIKEIPQ